MPCQNTVTILNDLRSAGSLTIDAITGITDIVESLHQTIISFGGIVGSYDQSRTKGITGMVYQNIRTITELVGDGIDGILEKLSCILQENDSLTCNSESTNEVCLGRESVISALNGVLGDHLAARNNPLAVNMQFRINGKALNPEAAAKMIQKSNGKIAIMIHGLCMNDLQWNRFGHDHGEALAKDLGYLPIYLHYNTGLHISENGKKFAALFESVMNKLFESIDSLQTSEQSETCNSSELRKFIIIAHSMGGLVSRSACYYGKEANHKWINHLDKIIFLGTPHHGSPLAKGGSWIDNILAINPYSSPFSRLGKIRSCGLTDLRHGNLLDDDWKGQDRFALSSDNRTPVPLPECVKCYSIAAATSNKPDSCCDDLVGDGLVTLSSAFGIHKDIEFNLSFPESHKWIARNMNHMDILNNQEVYKTIKTWIEND